MNDHSDETAISPLTYVLDDPVATDVLSVLIECASERLNPSRICDRADINLETFYEHIDVLEKRDFVTYTYIVGNGPMYELNGQTLAEMLDRRAVDGVKDHE